MTAASNFFFFLFLFLLSFFFFFFFFSTEKKKISGISYHHVARVHNTEFPPVGQATVTFKPTVKADTKERGDRFHATPKMILGDQLEK